MNDTVRAISIAPPTLATQAAIWRLAHETDNSHAYLLWCSDYFDQSLIARINGELAGFVVAGELRSGTEKARIIEVAISAKFPRNRVVPPLLDQLVIKLIGRGIGYVESALKSTDSELYTDLRALADRWHCTFTVGRIEPSDIDSPNTVLCVLGPLKEMS